MGRNSPLSNPSDYFNLVWQKLWDFYNVIGNASLRTLLSKVCDEMGSLWLEFRAKPNTSLNN